MTDLIIVESNSEIADGYALVDEALRRSFKYAGCYPTVEAAGDVLKRGESLVVIADAEAFEKENSRELRDRQDIYCIAVGNRDFDRIFGAFRFGIKDYVLYSELSFGLTNALSKYLDNLDAINRSLEQQDRQDLRERLHMLQQQRFFEQSLQAPSGQALLTNPELLKDEFDVCFAGRYFRVINLCVSPYDPHCPDPGISMVLHKLARVCGAGFGPHCREMVTYVQTRVLILIINYDDGGLDVDDICRRIQTMAKSFPNEYSGFKYTFGVSAQAEDVTQLPDLITQAKTASNLRLSRGVGGIYYSESPGVEVLPTMQLLAEEDIEALTQGVLDLDANAVCMRVRHILNNSLSDELFVPTAICVNNALMEALNKARPGFVKKSPYRTLARNSPPMAEDLDSAMDIRRAILGWITEATGQLRSELQELYSPDIREAIGFISRNFTKPIRMEDTAREVNLQSSYFSSKFKLQTGYSFVEYLTNMRVENAKKLLSGSGMKINQVSACSGFEDTRYFSRVFKKHTGMTPTEYRKRN